MSVTGEVKKLSKSKLVILILGILLGGTLLAGTVALIVNFVRGKVKSLTGHADAAASAAAGK